MRTLLSQCIYGGKVDNEFDQRLLESFLEKIFSEKCFEPDHPLVDSGRVVMPEGVRRDQFLGWIEQLADRQVSSFSMAILTRHLSHSFKVPFLWLDEWQYPCK